jgi:PAS domain S-box-containing protein
LELQNEELKQAHDEVETALGKYTDLYDFAPAGYFSLDEKGVIREVNLTGASLLGVEMSRLVNRRLALFVAPASRAPFQDLLSRVFAGQGGQAGEAALLKADGAPFWVDLHASSAVSHQGARKWCRLAVLDITARKQAEEAQRHVEVLAAANQELKEEIVRRQAVEEALKKSEQRSSQLLVEARQMQEQLRFLSHQILLAQEEERKQISRELHDDISQTLTGIHVHLATLTTDHEIHSKGLQQKIARTQQLVEQSVEIVHRFARELRPAMLDDLGLIPAMQAYLKEFTQRTGLHIHFTAFTDTKTKLLDNVQRTALYRVAQEALNNVARHAQASHVKVSLLKVPGAIRMEIHDNGKSFEADRVLSDKKNKRLGLIGMRERMAMIGGTFSVTSAKDQGTTIQVEIPVRQDLAA